MILSAFLAAFVLCSSAAVPEEENWNHAVDCYNAGKKDEALAILRPMTVSSPRFAARAAELVAKLEYDAGDLEGAAAAAQIALRANPGGEKENRNFTRATTGLAEARESRHVDEVMAKFNGCDPGALLRQATGESRELLREAGTYRTNSADRAVAAADALCRRARELADIWIPVRAAIVNSVTNEQESAAILQRLDDARKTVQNAAVRLEDLDGDAYGDLSSTESDFTAFFKLCVLPPDAIAEDFAAQSNAWQGAESVNGRDWQAEALDFTRAFREKFPAWARAYEAEAQNDTNREPFTAEAQAKISALATELEKIQLDAIDGDADKREDAMRKIDEIRELMPKGKSPGGQGDPPPDSARDPQAAEAQAREQEDESDGRKPDESSSEPEGETIEEILKKAEERSQEYEDRKKAEMRKAPVAPDERDW